MAQKGLFNQPLASLAAVPFPILIRGKPALSNPALAQIWHKLRRDDTEPDGSIGGRNCGVKVGNATFIRMRIVALGDMKGRAARKSHAAH